MPVDSTVAADAVEQQYRELEAYIHEKRPADELAPLEKAYRFAAARHLGQKRASGEPYMIHPLLVTRQLAEMNMDIVCLGTAILHDVVEDTAATLDEVRKEFVTEFPLSLSSFPNLNNHYLHSADTSQT